MISTGDTAVSLHTQVFIWRGGILWTNSNPKSLNLAKFSFLGGVGGVNSGPTQTQSLNLPDNFHFLGGGVGGTLDITFHKYLDRGTQGILAQNWSTHGSSHESSNLLPTWRFVYKQVWRQRVLKISLSDDINNNVEIRGIRAHRFPSHAFTWWTAVDEILRRHWPYMTDATCCEPDL